VTAWTGLPVFANYHTLPTSIRALLTLKIRKERGVYNETILHGASQTRRRIDNVISLNV